jgi:hypothetical protein
VSTVEERLKNALVAQGTQAEDAEAVVQKVKRGLGPVMAGRWEQDERSIEETQHVILLEIALKETR